MQENLYVNIGGKIKRLAFWTFIVEAIGAIISGIGLLFGSVILGGLAAIFFGPIVAWVSSWLLYGFGQLIENSDKIVENTRSKAVEEPTPAQPRRTIVAASVPIQSQHAVAASAPATPASLLKRAFMFLEDENWISADEYFEMVLDIDPENAHAYLGRLLSELRVRKQEALKDQEEAFDNSDNYQKAIHFADEELRSTLTGYIEYINTRNKNARLERAYTRAKADMSVANTENQYLEVASSFESIRGYLDSATLAQICREKAEIARKDTLLSVGKARMTGKVIANYEDAIRLFKLISGWKDADEMVCVCEKKIAELKEELEAERKEEERIAKKNKKRTITALSIVCALITAIVVLDTVVIPTVKYNDAVEKYNDAITSMDAGSMYEAYEALVALDGYKDSVDKANHIYIRYTVEKLKSAKVGDCVFFGTYEQDNDIKNGKEDVEWLVLEIKDGRMLVISKSALAYRQYNSVFADTTWHSCALRKWLNNDFINVAFNAAEKAMIPTVTVSADKNPNYNTDPGEITQDQVFLLSIAETNTYFGTDGQRKCEFADNRLAGRNGCQWLLRSPGYKQHLATYVKSDGTVNSYGSAAETFYGVRPALWIDLNL